MTGSPPCPSHSEPGAAVPGATRAARRQAPPLTPPARPPPPPPPTATPAGLTLRQQLSADAGPIATVCLLVVAAQLQRLRGGLDESDEALLFRQAAHTAARGRPGGGGGCTVAHV